MKKNSSLLLSGLLVSGMVLGATVTTPVTVHADNNVTTQAAQNVTNNVNYVDVNNNNTSVQNKSLQGTQGSEITYVPDGYAFVGKNAPLFGSDQATINVNVTKMVSVKVNYVDQTNSIVSSETVNGGQGNDYTLTNLPAGCSWNNDSEKTITLEEGKEYNIPVTRKVTNTVIFKTSDETEVGRTQVFGDKVGDSVDLNAEQLPSGYSTTTKTLTLQSDKNTQFVTVNKDETKPTTDTSDGVVTIKDKAAQLYTIYGNAITGRTLDANSSWKTYGSKAINGQTYYKVASNEWVNANDVTFKQAVTPIRGVISTNDVVNLVTKDGTPIKGRALNKGTDWQIFNKMVINGKTYYQVATNEWADGGLVTIKSTQNTTDKDTSDKEGSITPYTNTVTTLSLGSAQLYTKDGTPIKSRALGANTAWKTAHKMVLNGETYYQVATNEWVKSTSLVANN